jgi:two-component system response regulator YesN
VSSVLIVDDEQIAVESIQFGLNWSEFGISSVHTAYSVRQAKEIFENHRIDILLCDIEMPQASGLDLLAWVRERFPKTETIFLTSHADFSYAKQAIQLGSLDYMLKPILFEELGVVMGKATEKISKESEMSEYSQYGKYWFQHQPLLIERFWLDIINQTIPSNPEAVMKAAEERNIPYADEMSFYPVLIRVQRWHKSVSLRDKKILEYALKNSAEELIIKERQNGMLIAMGVDTLLAILTVEAGTQEDLKQSCQNYIASCHQYFYCDLSCYMGDEVVGHEMTAMVFKLMELDKDNVAYDNRVFLLKEAQIAEGSNKLPDMSLWAVLLKEGAKEKVLAEAALFFEQFNVKERLNAQLLHQFYQNFQQMLHYLLQTKGIQAHQLLSDHETMELSANATRSVTDLLHWIRHVVGKAMNYMAVVEQSQSVVGKVIAYIKQHISEELSRDDIAGYVYLNPDYLARIFKKETGLIISDYLIQERVKIAQELLANTDMPVAAVASQIGYSNFSYFSRVFKKVTDLNPVEYRLKYHTGRNGSKSRLSENEKS